MAKVTTLRTLGPATWIASGSPNWGLTLWRKGCYGCISKSNPRNMKSTRDADSLSMRWFVMSIWPNTWKQLDRHQGSFMALICFDSVIEDWGTQPVWCTEELDRSSVMVKGMLPREVEVVSYSSLLKDDTFCVILGEGNTNCFQCCFSDAVPSD